jgi:hypothetical protein
MSKKDNRRIVYNHPSIISPSSHLLKNNLLMFIQCENMNIGGFVMSTTTENRKNKHFILDQIRLKKAQSVLGTKTETETIEVALERVITEAEKDEKAWNAQERFIKNAVKEGLVIEDVFGHLEE